MQFVSGLIATDFPELDGKPETLKLELTLNEKVTVPVEVRLAAGADATVLIKTPVFAGRLEALRLDNAKSDGPQPEFERVVIRYLSHSERRLVPFRVAIGQAL